MNQTFMTQAFLFNHLWQSTAFAAVAALVAWALRRHQARVRFWIWMAASLKFLVPFSALAALGGLVPWPRAQVTPMPALVAVSAPFPAPPTLMAISPEVAAPANSWHLLTLVLLLAWAAGSAILLLRWCVRWRRLSLIARAATPSRRLGPIPVWAVSAAVEPGVFGIFRPVLLLPEGLEERLSPAQLAAVLAHERCHVLRRDNLWSALHMLVETLFWFHPLVWWIGTRLVAEREHACDEEVLRGGGDREAYAHGILEVCRFYAELPAACAAGVSGGELKQRVAAILHGGWGRNLSRSRQLLLASLAAVALLGPVAAGVVLGQTAPLPVFDVISVKPVPIRARMPVDLQFLPGRLVATNLTLEDLILAAYKMDRFTLTGGPGWLDQDRFDVIATTNGSVSRDRMRLMLQSLLADRFKLQIARVTRTGTVYTLTAPKPHNFKPPAYPGERQRVSNSREDGNGFLSYHYDGHNAPIALLTQSLSNLLSAPVVDKTGLAGSFDFRVNYSYDHAFYGFEPDPNVPTIFSALQNQLGLKLKAGKGPTEVYVVHAAVRPSPN